MWKYQVCRRFLCFVRFAAMGVGATAGEPNPPGVLTVPREGEDGVAAAMSVVKKLQPGRETVSGDAEKAIGIVAASKSPEAAEELMRIISMQEPDTVHTRAKRLFARGNDGYGRGWHLLGEPKTSRWYGDRPSFRALVTMGRPAVDGVLRRLREGNDAEDEERMDMYAIILFHVLGGKEAVGILEKERGRALEHARPGFDAVIERFPGWKEPLMPMNGNIDVNRNPRVLSSVVVARLPSNTATSVTG